MCSSGRLTSPLLIEDVSSICLAHTVVSRKSIVILAPVKDSVSFYTYRQRLGCVYVRIYM